MKQLIKDIGREALRQLFGLQKPRSGKIILTRHATQKMTEHKLDRETLENAFRHGRQGRGGMIIHTRLLCFAISGVNVILLGPKPILWVKGQTSHAASHRSARSPRDRPRGHFSRSL